METLQGAKAVNASPENVVDVLLSIMNKLGLREANIPGKDEMGILIHHLLTNYGSHTCEEITLAFDMAIAGKLELLPGESVNCYENFSCLYFSSIMNAYRRWAAQVHEQLKPLTFPEPPESESMTDDAMEHWISETRKMRLPVDLLPVLMYEYLAKNGKIAVTSAEKHEYLERAVVYRQGKLIKALEEEMTASNRDTLAAFNSMKLKSEFTGTEVGILKSLAKKMILYDYLQSL